MFLGTKISVKCYQEKSILRQGICQTQLLAWKLLSIGHTSQTWIEILFVNRRNNSTVK